jgi:hypothetical protein
MPAKGFGPGQFFHQDTNVDTRFASPAGGGGGVNMLGKKYFFI